MNRSVRILLLALAALVAVSSHASAATPPLRATTVVDDLGLPLRGWSVSGKPGLKQVRFPGSTGTAGHYAFRSRALRMTPGGSIARTLPERPWSLSLDARVPRGSGLRIDVGGTPLNLRGRANGGLEVGVGDVGTTLPAGTAGPGGWHHVEIAGFDPVELHVDGTRVPNDLGQGRRLRLRATTGAVQVTGLVATRRDDRRALLLHRLVGLHWATRPGRAPTSVGSDGVTRYERGRDDGFFAGALWNAYGLTGGRLFLGWGERATFGQGSRNDQRQPPVHWQGLRWLVSSANADQRTCTPAPGRHRCRLLRKNTGSTPLFGMSQGNPGNWAVPSVLWPRMCPTCRSSDEVEIRIETMMDIGILEWNHQVSEWSRAAYPNPNTQPSPSGPRAVEHAKVVERLLLRSDGSTAEGVRTNRLDGSVLSYEGGNGTGPGGTWARGHAGAVYGFARSGLRAERADLVAAGERAARYLDTHLPASRIPPHDFAAPAGPPDPEAGALYAAGLLRLARACELIATACTDGPRWRTLAGEMLDAYLARLNTHLPVGATPEGQELFGIHFALEAIERRAAAR